MSRISILNTTSKPLSLGKSCLVFLWSLFLILSSLLYLNSCSANQVTNQSRVAEVTAQSLNRALPVWIAEYQRQGRETIERSCCVRSNMQQALDHHNQLWQPVSLAWESAKLAHDSWRLQLDLCRQSDANSNSCQASLSVLSQSFIDSFNHWRCTVRSIGMPNLDPIQSPQPTCTNLNNLSDSGLSDTNLDISGDN